MIPVCQKCGNEGHTQENCTLTQAPCYKCGELGYLPGECSQMGRFALRHQIYDHSPKETIPFCHQCKEDGHWTTDCRKTKIPQEKREMQNKYQEAYEDLR